MTASDQAMADQRELIRARELVLGITLLGTTGADLDRLLQQLFELLRHYPKLPVAARGALYLYTPRGKLIPVARHDGGLAALFSAFPGDAVTQLPAEKLQTACVTELATGQAQTPTPPAVLVIPLRRDQQPIGLVTAFLSEPCIPSELQFAFVNELASALSDVMARYLIEETLRVRELEVEQAHAAAIQRLGMASEYRNNETGWHTMRMANFAVAIGRAGGLSERERELLYVAAPMHDVGKIGIADAILLKPDKLTPEEFEVMKQHTEIGARLLSGDDAMLVTARDIASSHHEHWDGSGYPRRLRHEEIPLFARICAVADVFDALTSPRPYKPAWEIEAAIEFIIAQSGKHFDPAIIEAFIVALPEILRIRQLYRDDVIDPHEVLALPQPPVRPDAWLQWDAALNIGIDVIDEHHRFLFDLTNDLYDTVAGRRGAREVARALAALDLYAKVHFRAEEQMMAHYGYAELDQQKRQHDGFEAQLKEFHELLWINPLTTQLEVLDFLRRWLVDHIARQDAKLRTLVNP